ncbi:MAG: hypothetical protein ACP5U2_07915 [Bryobacteraceae bacterium]
MTYPARLMANFRIAADQLQVDYTLTNNGREALYVIDIAIRVTAQGAVVHTGVPRVEFGPQGEVILASTAPPFDPSVSYAVPPTFYTSRLEAGASVNRSFALTLPLAPAWPPPRREPREITADRVAFVLGIIPVSAVPNAARQEIGGVEVWWLPANAGQRQIQLRAEAKVANLRVLVDR